MTNNIPHPVPASRRRRWPLLGLVGLAGLAFVAIPSALAFGPGHGGRHMGGHADFADAAELQEHLEDGADRALSRLKATDAQRDAIDVILADAAPELFAFKVEGASLKEEAQQALDIEQIDAEALEGVRVQGVDLFDRASEELLGTFVAVAQVLTPEQRAQVKDMHQRRHGRR